MLKKCPISQGRTSKSAARLASFFNILILAGFFYYEEPLFLYLLTVDFGIKAFVMSKSPLSRLALLIIDLFKIDRHPVDALPKQFAMRLGFTVLVFASLLNVVEFYTVAKVLVIIFLVLTFFEFSVGFCIGCYMYTFYLALSGSGITSRRLRLTMFFLLFVAIFFMIKSLMSEYSLLKAQEEIENILRTQLATRNYINKEQKILIQQLKENKQIDEKLYEPALMSSTYITRRIHDNYNAIRREHNEELFRFKLASANPLNAQNLANNLEARLIQKFNDENITEYKSTYTENGASYLYVALPTERIGQSCLQCHGKPESAPKSLTTMYGLSSGFGWTIGEIPAILSVYAPLTHALEGNEKTLMTIFFGMLGTFILIYFIFETIKEKEEVAKKLQNITDKQKKSLEKLNIELQQQKDHLQEYSEKMVVEYEKSQENLVQQSKMASMGEMLASITHQWKQPIATMQSVFLGLQMKEGMETVEDSDYKNGITAVEKQVSFMLDTMNDFKNFLRPDKNMSEFALFKGIDDVFDLFRIQYKTIGVTLETEDLDEILVAGYYNEYRQVVLNIINNARDAYTEMNMDDKPIYVRTFKEDKFGVIEICDKAGGVPEAVIPHIFDQYMSTKDMSTGTGIGLYMAKSIIEENMHGSLSAYNEGGGAVFAIKLPLTHLN
jgi:two-component system, NtrC family, C4-dicarboxylate transport sensor histidine kinase DctB